VLALGLVLVFASLASAQAPERPNWPGIKPTGQVLLPNGWSLKPPGRQAPLGDFPILIAEHPTAPILAILHAGYGEHEVVLLEASSAKVISRSTIPQTFGGLVWSSDGSRLFVGGGFDDLVYRFDHKDGYLSNRAALTILATPDAQARSDRDEPLVRTERGSVRPQGSIAGLALSRDDTSLWAANAFAHRLSRFDARTGKLITEIELGADTYPYTVTLDEPRRRAYVSLWGKEQVAVVDMDKNTLDQTWPTGPHPNEMLLSSDAKVLFVANANHNTVTVHDLDKGGKAISTIGTAIDPRAPAGCTPNALALSPDGSMLLVANANTNDLAAVNVKDPARSTPLGFIPSGWYPTSVRISRDGRAIWTANGKGGSSSANRDGPNPLVRTGEGALRQYIGGLFKGTLSIVPMPNPARMGEYTRTVYDCSPVRREEPTAVRGAADYPENPIPRRVGDPSPIKYCVYVIKENRTYDQVFGDIPKGNGDPAICLFPEQVTPNHHALANQFVLLDNFYVESEVSADGHEWTMGAYATDFVERTWPLGYRGDRRVPYPSEGRLEISRPAGGYLWDRARAKGVSYRSYGEFVANGATPDEPATTKVEALQGHFDPLFRSYDLDYPDVNRADRFLVELAEFERTGELPRLIVLRLPNDHTYGTRVGKPTPTAMVADNDLALGRLVEGLSQSRFWKEMAIFVVEDDAQNGSDHVDAHRTVALAISPYIKRGSVDSTLYTTSSMLRTMELILGLEPMSQFDAAARPMFASFTSTPDVAPYECRPVPVDMQELNLPDAPGARLSETLDLSREDAADDLVFNEIIWKAVKGADSMMPPPVRAAFVLPRSEPDDDDDD
jgi:DNA-binding beta-propeller fold protein YncE